MKRHTNNLESLPQVLIDTPSWLLWQERPHATNPNKTLKQPIPGHNWQSKRDGYRIIAKRYENDIINETSQYSGIGFIYHEDHPFICLDIDAPTDDNLALMSSLDTFTEISPSGQGFHCIVQTDNKQALINDFGSGRRDIQNKRDLFISNGYVTVTNNTTEYKEIRIIPYQELIEILSRFFRSRTQQAEIQQAEIQLERQQAKLAVQSTSSSLSTEQPAELEAQQPTPRKPLAIPYVQQLLNKIPVRCLTDDAFETFPTLSLDNTTEARTPWLIVGQALHHEFNGSFVGFNLWSDWSKNGNKYDIDALDATWRSFDTTTDAPITMATVIKLAEAQTPKYTEVDAKGKIYGTITNFYTYLAVSGITAATNAITYQPLIKVPLAKQQAWGCATTEGLGLNTLANVINSDLRVLPRVTQSEFSVSAIKEFLRLVSCSTFVNPVEEYFKKCGEKWDGKDRMPEIMETITPMRSHLSYTPTYLTFMRKWFTQVVAGACHKPDENAMLNLVIVFVGDQAIGKTKWVESIFPKEIREYCVAGKNLKHTKFQTESAKQAMELASTLICNINEIDRWINSWPEGDFKSFMDETIDRRVLPYGDSVQSLTRRTSFIGSTNSREFLRDPTGNRRIAIIHANKLNFQHNIDTDQLWGQFYNYWLRGETHYFDINSPKDARAMVEQDFINKQAFAFPDDNTAYNLDEMFDASAPISEWKRMTLKEIRTLIGQSSGRSFDVPRSVKNTIIAWREQIPGAPPPEQGVGSRARVYYWMPPLRTDDFPSVAFDMVAERDNKLTKVN